MGEGIAWKSSCFRQSDVSTCWYVRERVIDYTGVWKAVQTHVAPAKNVRLALALVERGEAPLGVVYKTDAQLTDKVKILGEFASDTHAAIVYPAAIVNDSTESEQFFQYLKSDEAARVFAQYGFQQ